MIRYLAIFFVFSGAAMADTTMPAANVPEHLFQLSTSDVESVVGNTLATNGAGENVSATIIGYDKSKPLFSYNKPITVELRGLTFDAGMRRWDASIMAVSEAGEVVSALPVNGRFEEVMDVPVLRKQIRAGEIIGENDIEIRSYPVARTRAETIRDVKELIGKSPKRTISAARPIRSHEIAGPTLVEKNGIVQIRYGASGIEITTTGQAMESGSKGDLIAVKNISSKIIIHAIVENANVVSIPVISRPANKNAGIPRGEYYAAN